MSIMKRLAVLLGFVLIVLISTAFYVYVRHGEDYMELIFAFLVIGAVWYFLRYLQRRKL